MFFTIFLNARACVWSFWRFFLLSLVVVAPTGQPLRSDLICNIKTGDVKLALLRADVIVASSDGKPSQNLPPAVIQISCTWHDYEKLFPALPPAVQELRGTGSMQVEMLRAMANDPSMRQSFTDIVEQEKSFIPVFDEAFTANDYLRMPNICLAVDCSSIEEPCNDYECPVVDCTENCDLVTCAECFVSADCLDDVGDCLDFDGFCHFNSPTTFIDSCVQERLCESDGVTCVFSIDSTPCEYGAPQVCASFVCDKLGTYCPQDCVTEDYCKDLFQTPSADRSSTPDPLLVIYPAKTESQSSEKRCNGQAAVVAVNYVNLQSPWNFKPECVDALPFATNWKPSESLPTADLHDHGELLKDCEDYVNGNRDLDAWNSTKPSARVMCRVATADKNGVANSHFLLVAERSTGPVDHPDVALSAHELFHTIGAEHYPVPGEGGPLHWLDYLCAGFHPHWWGLHYHTFFSNMNYCWMFLGNPFLDLKNLARVN